VADWRWRIAWAYGRLTAAALRWPRAVARDRETHVSGAAIAHVGHWAFSGIAALADEALAAPLPEERRGWGWQRQLAEGATSVNSASDSKKSSPERKP
jgi:hypothetical protein